MKSRVIQITGLALTIAYAAFIIWIYATEPRTFKEVATSAEVAAGTYQINQEKFDAAHSLFLREQFRAARDEWQRADQPKAMREHSFTLLTRITVRDGVGFTMTRICSSKDWKSPTAPPASR